MNWKHRNFDALKRYKSTKVDRRTWLHVPSGTPWSTSSDTHQVVEIQIETSNKMYTSIYIQNGRGTFRLLHVNPLFFKTLWRARNIFIQTKVKLSNSLFVCAQNIVANKNDIKLLWFLFCLNQTGCQLTGKWYYVTIAKTNMYDGCFFF